MAEHIDLGKKPVEVDDKDKTYYPSMNIPSLKGKIGDSVDLKVRGSIKSIDEEGAHVEFKKATLMKSMPEEDYNKLSDDEKDNADEKSVEDKNINND